jgi:uncharacterized membrane protein
MDTAAWAWMLVWVLALVLMVWLLVRRPPERAMGADALDILSTRFARGEIGQEEFERARGALLSQAKGA